MKGFEEVIKEKSDEDLIEILVQSHDYQPEFIELVERELKEVRNIDSIKDFLEVKSNEELIGYLDKWKCNFEFISLVNNELNERILTHENIELIQKIRKKQSINKEEKIHGWLTFFLIIIGIGGILSPIRGFLKMSIADYDLGLGLIWSKIAMVGNVIILLVYFCLAVYIIISFFNYKPNAVLLGKAYFIIVFVLNLLSFFGKDYESEGIGILEVRLLLDVLGFIYLSSSEQVKRLFPKKQRKFFSRDLLLLGFFVLVVYTYIFSLIVLGIALGLKHKSNPTIKETLNEERTLLENEYSDCLIIFKCPKVLKVEKKEMDDCDVFYNIFNDEISLPIYSMLNDTDSPEYFEKKILDSSNESFEDFESDVIQVQYDILNGNSFYIKKLLYYTDPVIKCSFSMPFNNEIGKYCVLSCYSITETEQLNELINSIRFK